MFIVFAIFCLMHTLVWYSTNYQLAENSNFEKSLIMCAVIALPISLLAFFGTKYTYEIFNSAWSVKLFSFSIGYIVFPILTWAYLNESPFTAKTVTCIFLATLIVGIQLYFPNN